MFERDWGTELRAVILQNAVVNAYNARALQSFTDGPNLKLKPIHAYCDPGSWNARDISTDYRLQLETNIGVFRFLRCHRCFFTAVNALALVHAGVPLPRVDLFGFEFSSIELYE